MKRLKMISFVIGVVCLTISAVAIFNNTSNQENNNLNNINGIETINKEYKIGINTQFYIITEYKLCNHTIEEKKEITKDMINLTYDDIVTRYSGYEIIEFDVDKVVLKRSINEFCGEHYLVKEVDKKIGIYKILDDSTIELLQVLDINIDTLRQSDRYMFQTTGVTVNGKENLYKFLEDYDS